MSDSGSEMSEWASEDDAPLLDRPVFKSAAEEATWERKQRNREYRVAARREKRNRKADEKKQRKLNATILRRMTKNPEKYNKNVDRNRSRDIETERRTIHKEAISQAQRLAAIHDPSGKMFNVGPVVVQDGGKVISVEVLERKVKAQAERETKLLQAKAVAKNLTATKVDTIHEGVNPARQQFIQDSNGDGPSSHRMSKNQQKKLAMLEERPPPPKPVIPEGISLPAGEENWLAMWDLPDEELERRVMREKKRRAAGRKALRDKQKEGKEERRAARDERRKVYREKKLEWKAIKEAEKIQKRKLLRVEQEEAKRIEVEVNIAERKRAMEVCVDLGFTVDNVEGVDEIKPKALGMKGQEVDFDILEIGDRPSALKVNGEKAVHEVQQKPGRTTRVDLGKATDESKTRLFGSGEDSIPVGMDDDFVSLNNAHEGPSHGQEFENMNYNHKMRRKLHRAIEAAQIKKELLVRAKAVEHCKSSGIEVPMELATDYKPIKLAGKRLLEDGTLETEKQERVRKRLELAEYNKAAKVLRKQAKAEAIEAGLRVFAELTGQKPVEGAQDEEKVKVTFEESINLESPLMTEPSKKRRRINDSDETQITKKSKPSQDVVIVAEEASVKANTKVKKEKESKIPSLPAVEGIILEAVPLMGKSTKKPIVDDDAKPSKDALTLDEENDTARKERKRLRKERKQQESALRDTSSKIEADLSSSKGSKKSNFKTTGTHQVEDVAEQWNADALGGGSARKDKFLRLLGAGKASSTKDASTKISSLSRKNVDILQVQDDLERQFDVGLRMKHDGQGKRRGLGA